MEARGGIACIDDADVIAYTAVGVRLRRGSSTLENYDSGWRTWLSHGRTVSSNCASGTHRYKNTVGNAIQFVNGSTERWSEAAEADINLLAPEPVKVGGEAPWRWPRGLSVVLGGAGAPQSGIR